jgi:transposase
VSFQDEARVGQKVPAKKVWADKGTIPLIKKSMGYESSWIAGIFTPKTGRHFGYIYSSMTKVAFKDLLTRFSRTLRGDEVAIIVIDGARFHNLSERELPANIRLLALPPYSPEINPAERVWRWMKGNLIANAYFEDEKEVVKACCNAWKALSRKLIKSLCRCDYADCVY